MTSSEIIETYLDSIIKGELNATEMVLQDAFYEHFGKHFSEVNDPHSLSRVIDQGTLMEQYKYRGETFLYIVRESAFREVSKGSIKEFSVGFRYIKV